MFGDADGVDRAPAGPRGNSHLLSTHAYQLLGTAVTELPGRQRNRSWRQLARAAWVWARAGILTDVKPSQRCIQDAELLIAFRTAYIELLNSSRLTSDGLFKVLIAKTPGADYQFKRRDVALAAGRAGHAYARYGGTLSLRNAAVIRHDVNPVVNWEMSLRSPDELPPELVLSSVESAIGTAEQEANDAAQRERGLTGLIAAFFRWPANLREAVGPDNRAQRTAAGAVGILGQIIVAAIATALGALLVTATTNLWSTLF